MATKNRHPIFCGNDIQVIPKKMQWNSVRNLMCVGRYGFSGKILGDWNKNIKKQPFSDASASHLSLVLCYVWFQANHINHKPKGRFFWFVYANGKPKEPSLWFVVCGGSLNQPHHITNAALSSEVGGIAKRIKTSRLRRKTNLQKSKFVLDKIKRRSNFAVIIT